MIQEYQNLQKQIIKNLKENQGLKLALSKEKADRQNDKKQFLLAILAQLDILKKHKQANVQNGMIANMDMEKPLLNILAQYNVSEIETHLYNLSEFAIAIKDLPTPQQKRKGYLYQGEVLRKAYY